MWWVILHWFIDYILPRKNLTNYANLFLRCDFKTKDKIAKKYVLNYINMLYKLYMINMLYKINKIR